jgi:hypothetical protein
LRSTIRDVNSTALDPCSDELVVVPGCETDGVWVRAIGAGPDKRTAKRSGKWLLWLACREAVASWALIAERTMSGDFWQAKITRTRSEKGHVVCVYTPDYVDAEDVRSRGIRLWQLGVCNGQTLWYKPDAFTEDYIYSGGGSASIYHLRASRTYLGKNDAGLELLPKRDQSAIRKALAALPVLPRQLDSS